MCVEHGLGLAQVSSPELAEQTHSGKCKRFQAHGLSRRWRSDVCLSPSNGPTSKTNPDNRVISVKRPYAVHFECHVR